MNHVIKERYDLVLWLHRIRKKNSRYGLLRADFMSIMLGKYMPRKLVRTNGDIHEAVHSWFDDRQSAEQGYGHINDWDTSRVTDMRGLFSRCDMNGINISKWDVSSVTNMRCMFYSATSFNADISGWDVSSVTSMSWMFDGATAFNSDICGWYSSAVEDNRVLLYPRTPT